MKLRGLLIYSDIVYSNHSEIINKSKEKLKYF